MKAMTQSRRKFQTLIAATIAVAAAVALAANVYAGALAELGPADAVKAPETESGLAYKADAGAKGMKMLQYRDENGGPAVATVKYVSDFRMAGSLSYCLAENPVKITGSVYSGFKISAGQDSLEGTGVPMQGGYKRYTLKLDGKPVRVTNRYLGDPGTGDERVRVGGSTFDFVYAEDEDGVDRLFADAYGALTPEEVRAFRYLMLFHGAERLWALNHMDR